MAIAALEFTPNLIKIGQNYLLNGTDAWLIDYVTDPIRNTLKKQYDVDVVNIYGDEIKVAELNDILDAYSLFAPQKLVVLRNAESLKKKELEALANYVASPSDSQSLIIINAKVDGLLKGWKMIRKHSLEITCPPPRGGWEIGKWLQMVVHNSGRQIQPQARELFVSRTELDYAASYSELQKIFILIGDRKTITLQDVQRSLGTTRVGTLIDFYRALGAKNSGAALHAAELMLGSDWEPLMVMFQINKFFGTIYKILLLKKNHISQTEIIAKHLSEIYETQRKEYLQFASNYSLSSFEEIFGHLLETDSALKLSMASGATLLQLCIIRTLSCR